MNLNLKCTSATLAVSVSTYGRRGTVVTPPFLCA